MTPEAKAFLSRLETNYKKAAFWSSNYRLYVERKILPKAGVVTHDLYLPADSWNAGHDARIFIPKNAGIVVVWSEDTYALGIGGCESDLLIGLWANRFNYGYGVGVDFISQSIRS